MTLLQKWIEIYFSGTYMFFLDRENSKTFEYHWYFAVSAVFMIVAYNLMFFTGLIITFGLGHLVLGSKYLATLLLVLLLLVCWAYFIRADRFREIVGRWAGQKQYARRAAMRVNWLLLAGFIVMAVRLVIVV